MLDQNKNLDFIILILTSDNDVYIYLYFCRFYIITEDNRNAHLII